MVRSNLTLTTLTTGLGFLLVQLDVSIVNVALASIGRNLQVGIAVLQWTVDAYAITFASLLLSAGALGDRLGSRRVFVGGLWLFLVGSLGCALAPGAATLIAARAVQGIGAATLVPCSLALLNQAARDDAHIRARAISLWTAAGSVGLALGPVLGGALIAAIGWRGVFAINLPIVAAAIWLTSRHVDEAAVHDGGADRSGQALAILSLFLIAGAVIEAGPLGWSSPVVWGGIAAAAVAFAGLVAVERRAARPMLPLGLFAHPTFSAATCVGFLLNLALYGALFVLGLYFQQTHHLSPWRSGLALLPFALAIFAANVAAGRLAGLASPRIIMTAGLALASIGTWLLRDIGPTTPYGMILPGLVLLPLGIGLAVPMMTAALLATVPRSRAGVGSGVLNAARQAGGAIGVALFGALMAGGGSGTASAFVAASVVLASAAAVAAGFIGTDRLAMFGRTARRVAGRG
ncbi:MAG TPA: MFS transporter [Acetobacteraceae bacterium]|nr:MFS transporter [Acetobacteraceae bacterium]